MKTKTDNFLKSSTVCLKNADRLISNAEFIGGDTDTWPTAYALATLAQEETSKAFLLFLVHSGALPWNRQVQRSLKDHTCKQLWLIALEALNPDIGEFLSKKISIDIDIVAIKNKVGEMLNWYRYAKIHAWEQGFCDWDEHPFDKDVKQVVNGKLDKNKQNTLYVKIDLNGKVISYPHIKELDAKKAIETGKRFIWFVEDLVKNSNKIDNDYFLIWLKDTLKNIFTPAVKTGKVYTNIPGVRIEEVLRPIVKISKKNNIN